MNKKTKRDLEKKYDMKFDRLARRYRRNLALRDDFPRFAEPISLTLRGETIEARSWRTLLQTLLIRYLPETRLTEEELFAFRLTWTSDPVFLRNEAYGSIQLKDGVGEGLYLNANHPTPRLYWLLLDLLALLGFDPNEGELWIECDPASEPREIKEAVASDRKKDLRKFLISDERRDEDDADNILRSLDDINASFASAYGKQFGQDDIYLFSTYGAYHAWANRFMSLLRSKNTGSFLLNKMRSPLTCLSRYYHKLDPGCTRGPLC